MNTRKRLFDSSEEDVISGKRIFQYREDEAPENASDDEDEDEDEVVLSTHKVSWETSRGAYTISIKTYQNEEFKEVEGVSATLFYGEESIGHLEGNILPRPHHNFYELGDAINSELQWLTVLFCNIHGAVSRVETNLQERDISKGGFFQIAYISIDKVHKGQDLGLRMIHEILTFLRGKWNIVVLSPGINDVRSTSGENNGHQELEPGSEEHNELIQTSVLKVARYFARMGFRQAGRNTGQCQAWFMTALTYFGPPATSTLSTAAAMRRWKTNEEIQTLDIFIPPRQHTPQGVDMELQNLVRESMDVPSEEFCNVIRNISDLVRNQHASIHGSRVMFVLAADEGNKRKMFISTILKTLITLSPGAVNEPDENGNCPLHTAASLMNSVAIRELIEAGASMTAQNDRRSTPLECIGTMRQDHRDFRLTFGIRNEHPDRSKKFLDSTRLLMSDELRGQLVDDWLPPRMLEMLLITAEQAVDNMQNDIDLFIKYRPKPIQECCVGFWSYSYFEYIPTDVFRRQPKGIYKSFVEGWQIVWEAISKLLNKKKVPTISSVEQEITTMERFGLIDVRKLRHFEGKGGNIAYALDALINTTEKVHKQGDCYWVYEDFMDDIEKHPETPLDDAFDVARVKCMTITNQNFNLQPNGPYNHDVLCGEDE